MTAAQPRTCLVAEDQALIAMLLQDQLEEFGMEVLGPFRSCAEALACLQASSPAFALIDYMLADGPCLQLAAELRRRGIPFYVLSGYDEGRGAHGPEWDGVRWLQKPIATEVLERAISRIAGPPA